MANQETTPPTPAGSALIYPEQKEVQDITPVNAAKTWLRQMNSSSNQCQAGIFNEHS
jgi:hypothetical protein